MHMYYKQFKNTLVIELKDSHSKENSVLIFDKRAFSFFLQNSQASSFKVSLLFDTVQQWT